VPSFPRVGCAAPGKRLIADNGVDFSDPRHPGNPGLTESSVVVAAGFDRDFHDLYLRLWVYKLFYCLLITLYIITIMMSRKKCIFFHFSQKKISRNYRRLQVL